MNTSTSFLGDLMVSIADRGRSLLGRSGSAGGPLSPADLATLCEALLSGRGEASGVALAGEILAHWRKLDTDARRAFLILLAERFGPDKAKLERAIEGYHASGDAKAILALHKAAEPRRQEVIRRLNLAPCGTEALVRIREELTRHLGSHPDLAALDADFVHLFSSWFNRGFLVLRRIDWTTPANILEKIIRYEAVHTIRDWNDLRRRLEPTDRRCFGFFHPQLIDEPLIFVQVALAKDTPSAIGTLLAEDRQPIPAAEATTAVFYSISNCQEGLRGVSFGNFLIKQVVEDLKRELPGLSTFVTLSPVPGFAGWLARERSDEASIMLTSDDKTALAALDRPDWHADTAVRDKVQAALIPAAASYLLKAKSPSGKPVDPVAKFHLGNGARLERLNFLGDLSERGLRQAHGLMVNYLYKLDDIETNHERFAAQGEVVASSAVRKLLRADTQQQKQSGKDKAKIPAGKG
ncbi:malonyl-CoA decarboxylase [Skermanella mucosa]|uniref:malonyl-CoA decarboxylase n=1 Tax=Skermanella mucosa TaxID=1789672 RepID=UPI00192BB9E9|nr:malonyl-CoA decarboxylase [Skermanella mucosa]UEM23809.1 malonyl-CoA decarboxylase [Skermanella mucosa]